MVVLCSVILVLLLRLWVLLYTGDPTNEGKKPFWISIIPLNNTLTYSRRNGLLGKRFLGYSICVRIFGYDLL